MSDVTKKYRAWSFVMLLISTLLCYLPLLVALVTGFTYSDGAGKVKLSICCIFALLLTVINIISKYSVRSTMWIILLGIYSVLDNVMPYLIAIAICTVLDEFIFSPLHNHFKNKLIINREIDKRHGKEIN